MRDYRLSNQQLAELRAAHRAARDVRAAYRINAVILPGRGWTAADVSAALLVDADTVRDYFKRYELFLVINRLEEFAAAVNDRLTSLDFTTKREIIRALVKRVEIHRDEIVVVFRVDPDPGFNRDQGAPANPATKSSRQDCRRRYCPVRNISATMRSPSRCGYQ